METEGTLKVLDFYPEDSNKLQYFYLKERVNVKKIRSVCRFVIVFEAFFYFPPTQSMMGRTDGSARACWVPYQILVHIIGLEYDQ